MPNKLGELAGEYYSKNQSVIDQYAAEIRQTLRDQYIKYRGGPEALKKLENARPEVFAITHRSGISSADAARQLVYQPSFTIKLPQRQQS
ncbi:MAG: hypothetical protein ACAH83_00085 [Alphaproteobacteria bacterium]